MSFAAVCMEVNAVPSVESGSADALDSSDIRRTLRGDDDAYARIVGRYQTVIATQMWKYSRDPRTVDELVQEVFVETYNSLRNFRGTAPFVHWLRRIATRVGYRHWKRKSREQRRREALERERPAHTARAIESPSEAAEFTYQLLAELPAADRLVLTLLYFEECDTHEIAERMGWTRSLVKVRAFRARKKLKRMLEEAGYDHAG